MQEREERRGEEISQQLELPEDGVGGRKEGERMNLPPSPFHGLAQIAAINFSLALSSREGEWRQSE